ncbi:hypothetical protein QBC40DRAFT_271322 [Triangularia verruculosa]|uniref:Uncharacterized protein n=1 Tax=Triangularia verruculosa TaxID=2587418 RepID=A0AAN7B0E5_9PEZI|nr:hypothetical protein QBC40DRAFT_271322 [Triangularia verruculosa]
MPVHRTCVYIPKLNTALTIISLPFMIVQAGIIIMGALSETKYMSKHRSLALRLSFAIPKSSYRIDELDQAVCLFIGHVNLVFSLWDALNSLREELVNNKFRHQLAHTTIDS